LAGATGAVALMPLLPAGLHQPWVVTMLALAGLAGGVMLVPMESFFQTRPAAGEKGAVIAVSNFTAFVGISLSGVANGALGALGIGPTERFLAVGGLTLLAAAWVWQALRKEDRP
ncbi:MAG: hypothetical protein NT031_10595, partial [Planctomycetota bacterium]|nr:hypothetical protein [Planctomycetota bacterium]